MLLFQLSFQHRVATISDELVDLGVHHENQHQELLLMDIKHVLSSNYALQPGFHPPGPLKLVPP